MFKNICILILLFLSGCSCSPNIREVGAITGFSWGYADRSSSNNIPTSIYVSNSLNDMFDVSQTYGELHLSAEFFSHNFIRPVYGVAVGVGAVLKYTYSPVEYWFLYIEGGAGPMYLSFDTYEQRSAGFNFLDQVGSGVEYFLMSDFSIKFGYRFSHISHARLRNNHNLGIDAHSMIFGISFHY